MKIKFKSEPSVKYPKHPGAIPIGRFFQAIASDIPDHSSVFIRLGSYIYQAVDNQFDLAEYCGVNSFVTITFSNVCYLNVEMLCKEQ